LSLGVAAKRILTEAEVKGKKKKKSNAGE